MNGLTAYARYGAKNPFNTALSNDELQNITSSELVEKLQHLNNYTHQVLYYGPLPLTALTASLKKLHKMPASFTPAPHKAVFIPIQQTSNKVLFANYKMVQVFANYKMVQAETRWIKNNEQFDAGETPIIDVFNNYFGGGMGAVVFQTIRESKALAYSTFAYYLTPEKKEDPFFTLAYVGSQADKFNEATTAMNELLNNLPEIQSNIDFAKASVKKDIEAKASVKKDIETQRITQDAIISNFLDAEQKGLSEDIRIKKYAAIDKISFADLKAFHGKRLANKAYTYAIVASEANVKKEDLEKLGELKQLSLEEIFGY